MIEILNISKVFKLKKSDQNKDRLLAGGYLKVVDNVTLKIDTQELLVLLGPNGAGKTTLIKIISGLLLPTSGEVKIFGKPVQKTKDKIGLMLGYSMIYYRMSGYDNLEYFARLYNVKDYKQRIDELAEFFGLEEWLDELVEEYSTGMKSKLALARAMIHNPPILLLDEPTFGLDPHIAFEVRKKIKEMGKTVILTTHYMTEAEKLADRIGFLNLGKLIKVDSPSNLKQLIGGRTDISLEEVFIQLMGQK